MYITSTFYWCTAIHKIKAEVDNKLIKDCDVELVFVHPWLFGEVKRIRIPKGQTLQDTPHMEPKQSTTTSTSKTNTNTNPADITGNDGGTTGNITQECQISLT